jgi:hypothetical protein
VELALGFSLHAEDKKLGITFKTPEEFTKILDWTPPSLYLLGAGTERRLEIEKAVTEGHLYDDAVVEDLDLDLFGMLEAGQQCFYMEFRRTEDAEYCRSVFLQG